MDKLEISNNILDDEGNNIKRYFDHRLTEQEKKFLEEETGAIIIKEQGPMAEIISETRNHTPGTYLYMLCINV